MHVKRVIVSLDVQVKRGDRIEGYRVTYHDSAGA